MVGQGEGRDGKDEERERWMNSGSGKERVNDNVTSTLMAVSYFHRVKGLMVWEWSACTRGHAPFHPRTPPP